MGEALGELGINPLYLVSQIINFLILFLALGVFVWRPLMRNLDKRREMLQKQERDAESVAESRAAIEQERIAKQSEARAEAEQILTNARAQAESIVESLRQRGVPHEYHLYEGEGHGWRRRETIEAFYRTVEAFLRQYVIFGQVYSKENRREPRSESVRDRTKAAWNGCRGHGAG